MLREDLHDLIESEGIDRTDAAEAFQAVYESGDMESEIAEAIAEMLWDKDYFPDSYPMIDAVAEDMARDATGAAFMARNNLVTNADVGIEEGDVILREPRDGDGNPDRLRVTSAPPEDTDFTRVNLSKDDRFFMGSSAGAVKYNDRYSFEE